MKSVEIMKKIKKKYDYMGIKNKTLFLVLVVIILVLFLFIYIFLSVFNTRTLNNSISTTKETLKNTTTNLDGYIDEVAAIANDANYVYYLQNYLIAERDNETAFTSLTSTESMKNYEMSSELFSNTINSRSDVSSIMIFSDKSMLLYKTIYSYMYLITDFTELPWYQKATGNPKKAVVTGPQQHGFLSGNTEKTISVSRVISSYEDGSRLGVILIDLNLNEITKICNGAFNETEQVLGIMNKDGELVLKQSNLESVEEPLKNSKNLEQIHKAIMNTESRDFTVNLNGEKYLAVYSHMDKTEWDVVALTPYSALTKAMYQTLLFILLIVLVLFFAVFCVLNLTLTRVIKPLVTLKEHMDLADKGNLNTRAQIISHDETGMLANSFNNMLERIENLMEQVVEEQEDKRKYELQALQAQINPHFLYNTLDSIIWMAEAKNPNVIPMTEALAKLFRISLNKGNEFIKIEDELEHVRNYLVIQGMRYVNKFDYQIEIRDEVRYCKTIKLIVQPIVENAIYHGIKMRKEKGLITIVADKENGNLKITVADNGNGMNDSICEEILTKEVTFGNRSGSGIGVKNVNQRIQLYFGESYGLSYKSILGKGTVATLLLPVIEDRIV